MNAIFLRGVLKDKDVPDLIIKADFNKKRLPFLFHKKTFDLICCNNSLFFFALLADNACSFCNRTFANFVECWILQVALSLVNFGSWIHKLRCKSLNFIIISSISNSNIYIGGKREMIWPRYLCHNCKAMAVLHCEHSGRYQSGLNTYRVPVGAVNKVFSVFFLQWKARSQNATCSGKVQHSTDIASCGHEIAPALVKWVKETILSLHVRSTGFYYNLHHGTILIMVNLLKLSVLRQKLNKKWLKYTALIWHA